MRAKGESSDLESERVRRTWNRAARRWDDFVETGLDSSRLEVHGPALERACGAVRGLKVLDIGCGQGYFSRVLAKKGAAVTGVDIAENMVRLARAYEAKSPLGIVYRVMDGRQIGKAWPPDSFDLVTACMSLHDMPDPGAVILEASTVLRKGGAMAFSVVHPLTNSRVSRWGTNERGEKTSITIEEYFGSGRYEVPWKMARLRHHWTTVSYRFTLGDWSRMIEAAGFVIQSIAEPRPTTAQMAHHKELRVCKGLPFFLVFRLLKSPFPTV